MTIATKHDYYVVPKHKENMDPSANTGTLEHHLGNTISHSAGWKPNLRGLQRSYEDNFQHPAQVYQLNNHTTVG